MYVKKNKEISIKKFEHMILNVKISVYVKKIKKSQLKNLNTHFKQNIPNKNKNKKKLN